uniref:Transposase domain-containing protein n=1 Tax=Anopheles arabiensis TaxID=7173 RepID=A0A182I5D3_ANOAR
MASNQDKKSGLMSHAIARLYKQRLEEVERELLLAQQPEPPTVDDAAPLSESEEENTTDASSGEDTDVEDIQVEVEMPDHPYGDLSCEDGLRMWALQTGQTHRSLNLLLGHLRHHFPQTKLPRDARTLMNTPASRAPETALTPIAGGQLWYQGVEKCLLSYFRDCQPTQEGFELNIFVDGLPLYKSSRTQFWPILMQAHNVPHTPVMTVAIFCGESNPLFVKEFLQPFVDEMNRLYVTGLTIKSRSYWVEARAIIADAPARAFIKGVKSHNAYSACMKCTIVGELDGHRMYFRYAEQCPLASKP